MVERVKELPREAQQAAQIASAWNERKRLRGVETEEHGREGWSGADVRRGGLDTWPQMQAEPAGTPERGHSPPPRRTHGSGPTSRGRRLSAGGRPGPLRRADDAVRGSRQTGQTRSARARGPKPAAIWYGVFSSGLVNCLYNYHTTLEWSSYGIFNPTAFGDIGDKGPDKISLAGGAERDPGGAEGPTAESAGLQRRFDPLQSSG